MTAAAESNRYLPLWKILSGEYGTQIAAPSVSALANRIRRHNRRWPEYRIRRFNAYANLGDIEREIEQGRF